MKAIIRKHINAWDPFGILYVPDEYDPEVDDIIDCIKARQRSGKELNVEFIARTISDVFERWLGGTNRPPNETRRVAKKILADLER